MQEPLYTPENMLASVDSDTGSYSIIKNIAQVATGTQANTGVNYDAFVDNQWATLAPTLQATDEAVANEAAAKGNAQLVEQAVLSMQQRAEMNARRRSQNYDEVYAKTKDLAAEAVQNVSMISDAVLINNSVEEVASNQEVLSNQLASQALLQKELEDATSLSFGKVALGILHEFSPLGPDQGRAIQNMLVAEPEKWGIKDEDVNLFTTRGELATMLRLKFQNLPQEEKLPWIVNLYNTLDGSVRTNKMHLSGFINQIVGDEAPTILGLSDWADRAGVALWPLQGVSIALKLTSRAAKISSAVNMEKTLAAAGGKGLIEAENAAKVAAQIANTERIKAGLEVASEVTGVQGVLDLTKLVSVSVGKVLPEAITMPVTSAANLIRNDISRTIDNLRTTNAARTLDDAVVAAALEDTRRAFSVGSNNYVHNSNFRISDDGRSIVGKVYYKPADRSSFLTKEAADFANSTLYGGKGKVVPDTTNTGFLVEDSVIRDLQLERDSLLAQLAEDIIKAPKRARKPRTTAGEGVGTTESTKRLVDAPTALKTSKPKYGLPRGAGTVNLAFENDIDKAAYIVGSKTAASKADATIKEWLQAVTGWDDKKIVEHGTLVRNNIKGASGSVEVVESASYRVPKLYKDVQAEGVIGKPSTLTEEFSSKVFKDNNTFTIVDNILYSSSTPTVYVLPFLQRLGKALGMDKHKTAVVQLNDVVNNPDYEPLVTLYRSFGADTKAIHVPTTHGSIILMGTLPKFTPTGKDSGISAYMQLFAHEYGHAFEFAFVKQYGDTFKGLFRSWLSSKNIKHTTLPNGQHISEALPIEALLEYRSISFADKTLTQKGLEDWVSKWYAGNKEGYLRTEKALHEWLASHSEFFAENFSKWALTDATPTTILGEAFNKLVGGIRTIATELSVTLRRFGVDASLRADGGVAKFLNDHIKLVAEGKVEASKLEAATASASKGLKPTRRDLETRVSQIEEELEAIAAARAGLRHGYLIEADVSKVLSYEDAGKFADDDIDSAMRFAFGDWALSAAKETSDKRVVGIHAHSRYLKVLTEFVRPSVEKLSKAEKIQLNAVLIKGDAEGKVFDEAFLAGSGLTQKTREAYYRVRALRDIMYQVKNDVVSNVLTRKGFFDLRIAPAKYSGDKLFGKIVTNKQGQFAYDISEGKSTRISATTDGIVFELAKPTEINGKQYRTVVIKADDVKQEQITDAIPYRTGEYRRQYEDEYWVKIDTQMLVDEMPSVERIVHRTAATNKDAKAYANTFNEMVGHWKAGTLDIVKAAKMEAFGWKADKFIDALNRGLFGDNPKANVYFNRTEDDFVTDEFSIGSILGKERGERIQNVYGNDNTLNPLDSIASEISNTAYVASTMDWREGQVAKWWNTFSEDFPPNLRQMRPEQALMHVADSPVYQGDNHRLAVARNTAKYIIGQLNILTEEEKTYLGWAKVFSEKLEGIDNPAMHKFGAALRQSSNWPQYVRTVAFHSFMGAFNIKHLFMQGMNAFNAVAISPAHGLAAAKTGTMYGLAMASDNERIWRQIAKANKLTNLGLGMSEDEFVESVRLLKRSGLLDGIQFNSMWGAEGGKFGLFNRGTRIASKVSATPFNIGDGYSRIVAFDIARREWKELNKGKAWWTDSALSEMLARQDDLTQNMTRANRATWQEGWKSIPFQFTQYQIKIAMNLINSAYAAATGKKTRAFTLKEAALLFTGHTLFLGFAGWGVWNVAQGLLPDEWFDENVTNMPDAERIALQQGIIAGGIYALSDGEVSLGIGSTFGTFNYYREVYEGIVDPEKTLFEALSGPGGFAMLRWLGKAGETLGILFDRGITPESSRDMLRELATGFSSINNAYKAYIANNTNNIIRSNSGKGLYEAREKELFFEAIGIPASKRFELDETITNNVKRAKEIRKLGDDIAKQMLLREVALADNQTRQAEYHANVAKGIITAHSGSVYEVRELLSAMAKSENGTRLEKELLKQLRSDLPPPNLVQSQAFKDR